MTQQSDAANIAWARDTRCVHHLVEFWAAERPTAPAVIAGESSVPFGELDAVATAWAQSLAAAGVGPEVLVGVCGRRSPGLIAGLLAILKAGGAYVPIDLQHPPARIAHIVEQASITHVLAVGAVDPLPRFGVPTRLHRVEWNAAPRAPAGAHIPSRLNPDNLAAVIFTSGSAGRPKGVMLSHRAIVARLDDVRRYPRRERSCQKASISVVAHISDTFLPLARGDAAVVISDEQVRHPLEFARAVRRYQVRQFAVVPSHLQALVDSPEALNGLRDVRRLIVSGEATPHSLVNRVRERLPGVKVLNGYGLTETVGAVTVGELTGEGEPTIGRPSLDRMVYVLDADMQPVVNETVGELYVHAAQLARGYFAAPRLTADHFRPNPFGPPGSRLLRTGDRASIGADGQMRLHGRSDFEVKVRGFRVNVLDIELALERHPAIGRAVVVAERRGEREVRLRAYVSPSGVPVQTSALRSHLQQLLPAYMVPASFVWIADWPLLPNGKVDRQSLASLWLHTEPVGGCRPPAVPADDMPLDVVLEDIWRAELALPAGVRPEGDFFELGGDSLVAMRILAQVMDRFGVEMTLEDVLEAATVAQLGRTIEQRLAGERR